MYPLVLLFGIALWTEDKAHKKYTLALSILGGLIAIYHNLLYYKLIPDNITPCTQGISCTTKQIELLGFITIPLLSLVSFILLIAIDFYQLFREKTYEKK